MLESSDDEQLAQVDDKELLVKIEPQELYSAAVPLPLKMPVSTV